MKITTDVSVSGKPKPSSSTYDEGRLIAHKAEAEITELSGVSAEELSPQHIDALRERVAAALKDAGKRLAAELDTLEEQAQERLAQARREARAAESEAF